MTCERAIIVLAVICILNLPNVQSGSLQGRAHAAEKQNLALLIGVSVYPNLGAGYQLRGPSNDVALFQQLLQTRFGFEAESIVVLCERHGQADPQHLPTRANIEREMAALVQAAQSGAWVVVLFAGHGSQSPQPENARFPEPDGLDEILLPRDVRPWDEALGAVPQAIVDDELGAWIAAIRARGALVWLIVDACHSGTVLRGPGEVVRQAAPEDKQGLAIPHAALQEARRRARLSSPLSRSAPGAAAPSLELTDFAGVVALYACQPWEVTVEKELPPDLEDREPHGLLTYTLCQTLSRSTAPLTYRQLAQRLFEAYVDFGRASPSPFTEGGERDRVVLDAAARFVGTPMTLQQRDGKLVVNAGALLGLTQGAVLAVHAPAPSDAPAALLGHVEVTGLSLVEAQAVPVEFDGSPRPEAGSLTGGQCSVAAYSYNQDSLRVMVDRYDDSQQPIDLAVREPVAAALEAACAATHLARTAPVLEQADWLVRVQGGQAFLIPAASHWFEGRDAQGPLARSMPRLGPAAVNDRLSLWLRQSLERISRAERLRTLAATEIPQGAAATASPLGLAVDVRDAAGKSMQWPAEGWREFQDGDRLEVVLSNEGRTPLDVTLLYIDSGFGIDALFPTRTSGESNRLQPGTKLSVHLAASARTTGLEHLIVIAVPGKGPLVDFICLEQPTLSGAVQAQQERGIRLERGLKSPLGRLLAETLYPTGLRSVRHTDWQDCHLSRMSWFVTPAHSAARPQH